MIKTKDSLSDLSCVLGDKAVSALEKMVYIKRAEKYIEAQQALLIRQANDDYAKICQAEPGNKFHLLLDGLAMASDFGLRAKWEYPPEIVKQAEELKKLQDAAQATGKARNIAKLDLAKNQTFTLKLSEK